MTPLVHNVGATRVNKLFELELNGFQHRADAERFLKDFQERLAKLGLEIQLEKT